MRIIIFLGNSVNGILADVVKEFEAKASEILIIKSDNDRLEPPAGYACETVSGFMPDPRTDYRVIANGGRSVQSFPVIKKLVEVLGPDGFKAYDLQRDGCSQVW